MRYRRLECRYNLHCIYEDSNKRQQPRQNHFVLWGSFSQHCGKFGKAWIERRTYHGFRHGFQCAYDRAKRSFGGYRYLTQSGCRRTVVLLRIRQRRRQRYVCRRCFDAYFGQTHPRVFGKNLDIINDAACVVTDTNIPNCLDFLIANVTVPVFLDTVSAKKTAIANDKIKNIRCIKPNEYEAEILSGVKVSDEQSALDACQKSRRGG